MKAITPESAKKNTDKAISSTGENEKQSLTDDLSVIEARAEASVGMVRSLVDSWLPATYKDTPKKQPIKSNLYNNSSASKQVLKHKLHKSILGKGNKKDSDFDQDESLLKTGSLKSSVYSADSKLSASSNGSRVSKPRPLDPLSMYLEKSKKKRSKR
ncbi:hypothetical protein BDV3_002789 [Batrachochytrium dendrobatidis]|nr:hypothetical protein O5D80_000911 [Batrachochytrium dendrobatidis]KAK5672530.1 hypothetical protein QVD99_001290 [Batrachochytrium dendrobatidis]